VYIFLRSLTKTFLDPALGGVGVGFTLGVRTTAMLAFLVARNQNVQK